MSRFITLLALFSALASCAGFPILAGLEAADQATQEAAASSQELADGMSRVNDSFQRGLQAADKDGDGQLSPEELLLWGGGIASALGVAWGGKKWHAKSKAKKATKQQPLA